MAEFNAFAYDRQVSALVILEKHFAAVNDLRLNLCCSLQLVMYSDNNWVMKRPNLDIQKLASVAMKLE